MQCYRVKATSYKYPGQCSTMQGNIIVGDEASFNRCALAYMNDYRAGLGRPLAPDEHVVFEFIDGSGKTVLRSVHI